LSALIPFSIISCDRLRCAPPGKEDMRPSIRVLAVALSLLSMYGVECAYGVECPTTATTATPSGSKVSNSTGSSSTGKKIGQIIEDAIGVAAPSVEGLINNLFPGKANNVDKTKATSVACQQTDAATEKAKASVKDIAEVSGELGVVSDFLTLSVPSSQRVSRILERLDQPISGKLSAAIKPDWTVLGNNLKKLGDISNADLKKVQDGGLRLQLTQVRDIYSQNLDDISNAIDLGSLSDVKDQLRAVQTLLNSIVTAAGIEIANLQTSLDSAVQWANNIKPQGGGEEDPRISNFKNVFDEQLALARKTLKRNK
jgi:hypothetical protein